MQISLSLVGLLSDSNGGSPVDATIKSLAQLRDEGFRRVWMAQLAKQLKQRKEEKGGETGQPVRGLISICAAGGQGVAAILEA